VYPGPPHLGFSHLGFPGKRDDRSGNYSDLEEADVLACIAYGAEMSRERYFDIPPIKET
jgi:hypothetical protein